MMKKRTLFLTLALTMAMSMTALTGCGTKTSATDDAIVEETPTTEEDTMKEEVVVAGEDDTSTTEDTSNVENDIPSTTYGDLVVYNDAIKTDYEVDLETFQPSDEEYTLSDNVDIYYTDGWQAGYLKKGATISVYDVSTDWIRIYNPEKTDTFTIDFLLVKAGDLSKSTSSDVTTNAEVAFTQDEVLKAIQERFSNKDMGYELLDAPESDMQKAEFSVSKTETIPTSIVDSYLYAKLNLSDYTKFYIEENGEDNENYNFVIYYKDLYQAE